MIKMSSKYLQYLATVTGDLNIMAVGAMLGWVSPTLPKLSEDPVNLDNPLGRSITKDEGSWIVSLVGFGAIIGGITSSYITELCGRKRLLLINNFPLIIGWILVGTATNIYQIYIGRFVLGYFHSIVFAVLPMYTGEISEPSIRGATGSLLQVFLTLGFLFSYSVGPFVSYTIFWLLCVSLHVIAFLSFMLMPESPYYLLSKGRKEEAAKSLARLRNNNVADDVQNETEDRIRTEIDEELKLKIGWRKAFKDPINRKAVFLASSLMILQDFIGIDVVLSYAENIFRNAGARDSSISAIIIGLVQFLTSPITPIVVDRSGRKILLVISSLGCGIASATLGTYFFLQKQDINLSDASWLPIATLIVYMISYCIGCGPLPWTILSEMFGPDIKSKASSICVFSIMTSSFLTTKFFPIVEEAFGSEVVFWFFSICAAVNIIYILTLFPETKGKTLAEIQDKLGRGKVR